MCSTDIEIQQNFTSILSLHLKTSVVNPSANGSQSFETYVIEWKDKLHTQGENTFD